MVTRSTVEGPDMLAGWLRFEKRLKVSGSEPCQKCPRRMVRHAACYVALYRSRYRATCQCKISVFGWRSG